MANKQIIVWCLICGKDILAYPCHIKMGRKKFCSRNCLSVASSKRMKLNPINFFLGKKLSEEHKRNIGLAGMGHRAYNWKGGFCVDEKGYRRIWDRDKKAYVKEHRRVMETNLGRLLKPHENVHHKNGDRKDNRIDNLELWSVSQPSGGRVEDKIKWAKDFLAEYN